MPRSAGAAKLAACLVTACTLGVGSLAAPRAEAQWRKVSPTASSVSPYFVCPQQPHGVSCQAIEDPTRRLLRRGRVVAGALPSGVPGEASPALYGSGVEGGYSPSDLRSAYTIPAAHTGSGQTVAVVAAFDDPNAQSDLGVYRSTYGLPSCASGCFEKVDQTGGTSYPGANEKWAAEISMDIEMVSALCPNCHILLVEAKSSELSDLAAAENTAVALGASAISDSYLGEEAPSLASAYRHPGVPIAAAAGDGGYGVHSPASYPGVIAVGGTSLRPAGGRRGWAETVWSGTGSGCTGEPKPAWQRDEGCAHRAANDVAAVADPNTPVSVYDSYLTAPPHWLLLGGTSAAAPIVAATMAMATPYTRSFEGAEALYLEVASASGGFNDIAEGSNGTCGSYLCKAEVGYDGPSGLGSLLGVPELPVPVASTGTATAIGAGEATLQATVDTHGAGVSACTFQYGATSAYESSVPCSTPAAQVNGPVTARLTKLQTSSEYHFRVHVEYATGSAAGEDAAFATVGGPPTASTLAATAVASSSARLNGTVDPHGPTVLECEFEYGTGSTYTATVPCSSRPGPGSGPVAVSAPLTGLVPGTRYHYRLLAATRNGMGYGADQSVTLLPLPPAVTTSVASAVSSGAATLNGTVDSGGAPLTACEFEFDNGETLVPCAAAPSAAAGPTPVHAVVGGLAAGSTHIFRLLAADAGGSSYAGIEQFTTQLAGPLEQVLPVTHSVSPAPAVLAKRTIAVRRSGSAIVAIRCATTLTPCQGHIKLQSVIAGHDHKHGRTVTLATASFSSRGATVTVNLHLSRRALQLLGSRRALRALAVLVTVPPAQAMLTWRAVVSLRPAAAPHP